MFLLVHIRNDGSVNWMDISIPIVPDDILEEGELGFILHPLDIKRFEDFQTGSDIKTL